MTHAINPVLAQLASDAGKGSTLGKGIIVGKKEDAGNDITKLTIPLSGKEYWLPSSAGGRTEIGIIFPEAFSVVRGQDGKIIGIEKHANVQMIGTGMIMETVNAPSWWSKRNDGVFSE